MKIFHQTKILFLISAVTVLFMSGSILMAQITVKGRAMNVVQAIAQIEKSSGYSFFYNAEDLNGIELGDIDASGTINEILEKIFSGTGITYKIQGKEVVIQKGNTPVTKNNKAGQHTVSGIVIDSSDKQPVAGASVLVKNRGTGTFTDEKGRFTIAANADDELEIGFLGYRTVTKAINGRDRLTIALVQEISALDAVVMMGYSTAKKTEMSSSVVSMQGESLRDVTTSDIGNMLQGKAAGVLVYNSSGQPGEAATIRIRGTGSITATADPLYVVDGIPGGSFNPNDIESITVLKDAGATSLYGSNGAGGVIVVTTKKAKSGQKTSVEFKLQGGIKQALYGRFRPMNSEELYLLSKSIYPKAVFKSLYPKTLLNQDFSWMDEAFNLGNAQDYYASVAGSSEKATYFVSLDHYREKGTLINTGYAKTAGRINLGLKLYENLDMNLRLQFNDSNDQGTSSYVTLESAYRMSPWDNPYDQNTGKYLYVTNGIRTDNGGKWYSHDKVNVFHNEIYNSSKSNGHNLTSDLQLIWRITEHLSLTTTNRYAANVSTYKLVIDPRTASASYPKGIISKNVSTGRSFSTSNLLKYSRTIASDHNLSGLLGQEWGLWKNDYTIAEGTGMKSGLTVLNAASPNAVGGYYVEGEGWSLFGQAQYSYKEKYIATASLRADANSVFAPKQRIGYFPSVSLAWLISKEKFMENQNLITFLKLRASYGETGNSGIEPYSYLSTYTAESAVQYQGKVGMYPKKQENPYLHWERARMTNIGFDINLKNRLEINLDLYNIINNDLLLDVPTAPSTGFSSITKNTGAIRNRGIEFQLNSTNIKKKNFTWTTGFNIGFNKNTVLRLPDDKDIIKTVGSNSARQIIRKGESLYSWYMPKWAGVNPDNGDPQWEHLIKDADGNVTGTTLTNVFSPDNDSQIVGCASPLFSGGLSNTFTYRNLSLAINLNFVYGNDIFNYTRVTMDTDGHYTDYNQMSIDNGLGWSRWKKPGDIATHPKAVSGGNKNADGISSRYLENGSFLRIKNVTLSYNVPKSFCRKLHLDDFKIFLSGDNLYTLSRFSGMDPEVRLQSTMYELAGMYSMNYPVGRTAIIGVNFKF